MNRYEIGYLSGIGKDLHIYFTFFNGLLLFGTYLLNDFYYGEII